MSSLVLDLQQQVLNPNCDVLNALRKAHLIAVKLGLHDFDAWIQTELNGYSGNQDSIPDYRQVHGELKAWNPYHGWIPVVLQDERIENAICSRKLSNSMGDILELDRKSKGTVQIASSAYLNNYLNQNSTAPFSTKYSLHVSSHQLRSVIEKVVNCLLEWTIKLETDGILGENMSFNDEEKGLAKFVPQQVNYYFGTVVNGEVSQSQIVSGDQNTVTFNYEDAVRMIEEIRDSLAKEHLSDDDMDIADELVSEIEEKVQANKKPNMIRASLSGLKDFLIGVGASATVAVIQAKMQGLF